MATKRTKVDRDHERRIAWWRDARFGMFIHWGVYAVHGRSEWALNVDRIPMAEYETLADRFRPKPRAPRAWARLARAAGMKYMVLTTKHHDGFCLWDTKLTDWNAVRRGPKRDLIREYVDAAREFGLKVGFYYSLMDWHHPDGAKCALDKAAYKRFIDFVHGGARELMTNYGKIDILWYDLAWPFMKPEEWQSRRLNAMVRKLQPDILINDRSLLPEDFSTQAEGHVTASGPGRDWEACVSTGPGWGYSPGRPKNWKEPDEIVSMLRSATAGQGNLLLNIGPKPDGSVPERAERSLKAVGKWLDKYGKVIYGKVDRIHVRGPQGGAWTRKGDDIYLWCFDWPGEAFPIGGFRTKITRATLLADGRRLKVEHGENRVVLKGLPRKCPDPHAGVPIIKLRCKGEPELVFTIGLVELPWEKKERLRSKKKRKK